MILMRQMRNPNYLNKILKETHKRLKNSPDGTIQVQARKKADGKIHFYYVRRSADSAGRVRISYIRKGDSGLISALADKKYCLALEKVLKEELTAIKAGKLYDSERKYSVYEQLPYGIREFVVPLCKSSIRICQDWQAEPYERSNYEIDGAKSYITKRGERVRSRAECIIANLLDDFGLCYRYEAAFHASDGSVLFPDFTIMHPKTNQLYYLEYWGLMNDSDYVAHFVSKTNKYAKSGASAHLISLFEDENNPLDTKLLDQVIQEYFFSD